MNEHSFLSEDWSIFVKADFLHGNVPQSPRENLIFCDRILSLDFTISEIFAGKSEKRTKIFGLNEEPDDALGEREDSRKLFRFLILVKKEIGGVSTQNIG